MHIYVCRRRVHDCNQRVLFLEYYRLVYVILNSSSYAYGNQMDCILTMEKIVKIIFLLRGVTKNASCHSQPEIQKKVESITMTILNL